MKQNYTHINMFSNNCGGSNKKIVSLKCELSRTQSSIFNLQETHLSQKGKLSIDKFHIYEAIRQKEHGSMLGVHESLQPVLVSEYSDSFEMIVVEIKASKDVRVIVGKYSCWGKNAILCNIGRGSCQCQNGWQVYHNTNGCK